MGGGEQAAAALRNKMRSFRERGEIPEAVGYGLPTALILLALLWPFLYGVVPSRAVWKSTSASGAPRRWRGGRRDDSEPTRRKILISTQVPRPPLDFDACWLACLKRARARGDTRRGGFLDSCLEPCYPPPGDECRSLRLRYGIRAGTSWGAAADSAAVQARWAALSCDELVGDGVANKWRA